MQARAIDCRRYLLQLIPMPSAILALATSGLHFAAIITVTRCCNASYIRSVSLLVLTPPRHDNTPFNYDNNFTEYSTQNRYQNICNWAPDSQLKVYC